MRILIVEDELLVAKSISMMLSSVGHEVVEIAGSLSKALDAMKKAPELAIVDAHLGDATTEAVVSEARRNGTRIVLMSGQDPYQLASWSEGIEFLSKPFGPGELIDAVDRSGSAEDCAGNSVAHAGSRPVEPKRIGEGAVVGRVQIG